MKLPITMRPKARAEYDAAVDWYGKQRRPGLDVRFIRAVNDVMQLIAEMPHVYQVVLRDIRQAPVPGFPYCVHYRVRPSAVVVLSVFHTSRDPSAWQSRS